MGQIVLIDTGTPNTKVNAIDNIVEIQEGICQKYL